MSVAQSAQPPRVGMVAVVRRRRALVTSVQEFPTKSGQVSRLVGVEYLDADGSREDQLLWECEPVHEVIEPRSLPNVESTPPMPLADFEAVERAARWQALSPFVHGNEDGQPIRLLIASPLFGAIQVEDFQLKPLVKALTMPRVSILLADDVGLGKSIEAGLILSELIRRRRIRRVLILCPAWLRRQWKEEMKSKFNLGFEIVDRYDLDDTEGKELPAEIRNFAKAEGEWNPRLLELVLANAERDRILVQSKELGSQRGGFATTRLRDGSHKMRIVVHSGLDDKSRYSVLCHELAHSYLGHLGTDKDIWWPCRTNLTHQTVEIEAESVPAIVCTRAGLTTTAAAYLAMHLKEGKVPSSVSLELIVKVAGKLEEMGTRTLPPRKPKKTGRKQGSLF
jgi:SNF2-related domain